MSSLQLGKYRHYKGNYYLVLGTAKHSETHEDLVVYVALYDNDTSSLWVRPKQMFLEDVAVNGQRQPRFTFIRESD